MQWNVEMECEIELKLPCCNSCDGWRCTFHERTIIGVVRLRISSDGNIETVFLGEDEQAKEVAEIFRLRTY